jgi:hypothetical protein
MGHTKSADGFYHIHGHKYELLVGSRAQVLHGTAYKTTGNLTKSNLIQNKNGRIVSKSKHNFEKKSKRLLKHGYGTQKGKFGAVRIGSRKSRSRGRRHRGGYAPPNANFSDYNQPSQIISNGPGITSPQERALYAAAGGNKGSRYRGGYSAPMAPMTSLNDANLGFSKYVDPQPYSPLSAALTASGGRRKRGKGGSRHRGGYSAPMAPMTSLNDANLGFSKYVDAQPYSPLNAALSAGL